MAQTQLRAYVFLDSLQPQLAAHICTTCRGYFPVPYVASLFVEIAPGMAIHQVLDVALKGTAVQPATLVIERAFGMLEVHHADEGRPASTLNKVCDALPGLGIVAAVLGIVITMGAIDGPPAEIGHKVGAALVGTFLGILMSYGFMQPLASSLEQRVQDDGRYEQCIKAGVMAAFKGMPPAIAVEFARRVLPHEVRPSFEETEQFCRASRGTGEQAAAA